MAFFHQLKLLLWKNGLGIIRRPVWSVTLILWPIIIFIIIAVTRHQFPPVLRQTCYVGPRNLPSTGFFPFLETLMCNIDSDCHNTSRLTPNTKQPPRAKRSTQPSADSTLSTLMKAQELMQYVDRDSDTTALLDALYKIFGSPPRESVVRFNRSSALDQVPVNLTETGAALKSFICGIALPLIEATPPNHVATALNTFCRSNNTAFEVVLNTVDQVLIELMTSQPEQLAKLLEEAMKCIDQLQNERSLWESLRSLPHIFNPKSPDQLLADLEKLLSNLQKILNILEHSFPEVKNITSSLHPFLVAGIRITEYMQNWPGRHVSIRFGDVVSGNESLWQMVGDIEIPLHKAIALAFDRNMAREFICKNSSGPMWMAACATGSLDMFLRWICPDKLTQQILLSWSKFVAEHDVAFFKGMVHSLGGSFEGTGATRTAHSNETQPRWIEEELFLEVGKVVLSIIQLSPDVDAIVQYILAVDFQSSKAATQAIVTVESMMENVVTDVATVHMVIQTLMTNQHQTNVWMNQALNSVFEIIAKILACETVTCDTILDQFEWVFSIKTIKREVVQSLLCGNTTTTGQALLTDWIPLIRDVEKLYNIVTGQEQLSVSLSMSLSQWHKLYDEILGFEGFLLKLEKDWSEEYWMNWISENSSANHLPSTLQQSVLLFMVKLGQKFEESTFWPKAKDYIHMAHWIFNSTDTSPPNCTINMYTGGPECEIDFDWSQFIHELITTLLSPSEEVFISCLKRSVRLLQHVYSDLYKHLVASNLQNAIPGGDMLSAFLINMFNKMDDFAHTLTTLPDQSFSNPQVMLPLYAHLLKSVGFEPLLPLIMHNGPVNVSQVLEAASKLGRTNQGIFTFNESDPTMAQLEYYIFQFLSMEGNLSLSLYLGMSQTMLTYHTYFNPEDVPKLKHAIRPFTSQTSSGIVEVILSSLELLKEVMNDPSPSHVILGYIHQLQQLLLSLFRIQSIQQIMLPNGQVSSAQVTDLHLLLDIFKLLTPEAIMNLTHCGPVAAQHMIIQKYVQTLPAQVREESTKFLNDFVALQSALAKCDSDQDCLGEISELLDFLDQILDMTTGTRGNVTINIGATEMYMGRKQFIPVACAFISLTLNQNDAAYVKTVQETLQFISILLSHPNITLSSVQEALKQANLTTEELNNLLMWLGTKDVNDLLEKVTKLQNAQKCFEQTSPVSVAHCTVGMVSAISDLLMRLPVLQNQTSILSMIPDIVNKTVTDMIRTNFTSSPQNALAETLKATLASVKMALKVSNMSSPEIQNEMEILTSLIELIGNPEPLKYLNVQLTELNIGMAALEMVHWYLERLETVTSSSSISDLLYSIYRITQMQVALQLGQLKMNQFIIEQVWNLTNSLQYPINGEGVGKIGNTITVILEHVLKFIVANLEAQNIPSAVFGYDPPINMTSVNATVMQIHSYMLFSMLLSHPNITLSSVQEALKQANLTTEELNNLLMWLGSKDVNDLLEKVTKLQNAQKCFEQSSPVSVAHCAVGMVSAISDLLMGLPALQNHTSILSMIPNIVNKTVTDMIRTNFTSSPHNALAETLKAIMANVKMTLKLNNISDPEIQNEIKILTSLIELIGNPEPLKYLNVQLTELNTTVAALEMVHWYLERLENVTSSSSISDLLYSIYRITQMQVTLQLGQMKLNQFITDQLQNLANSLQYPINGEGVVKIGNTTTVILEHVLKFVLAVLKAQNIPSSVFGYDPPINMTSVNGTVMQIHSYIKLLQQWMIQANFEEWGNLNYTSEIEKHIYHLVQSTLHFFNVDQQGYLHAVGNITQALDKALMLAIQPNGLQSEQFSEALLEAVKSAMDLLIQIYGPLPLSIQQSVLSVIKNAFRLALHPEASYATSVNATLDILHNLHHLIEQIFPQEVAHYLNGALKIIISYFESVRSVSGPDGLNQLILNEMYTVESLLPPNSTAQFYISTAINITKAILQPVQGNHSLLSLSPSEENIPHIFAQVVRLLNTLCPLFMGESCKPLHKSSLEGFADLPYVLEKLMTGQASNETWKKLQEFVEVLLTFIEPHMSDENLACFVEMFEKLIGNEVKNGKAETGLILSLQAPVLTLVTNLTHSLNGSHFNVSEFSERLGFAIEETVNKFEKANGTLTCQEVLKLWEPVRQAAGLSPSFMAMWCNISLQPVIDAYVKDMSQYTQDNWTCTEMGPMSAKAAAARMVMTLRSLYHTEIKQSNVTDQFIQALYTRFYALMQQPLSHEEQLNLYKQFQQWQIQSSLFSIKELSKQLENEFPFLKPYLKAVEKMLSHILMNYHQMNEPDSIFSEAVMILLSSIDVPENDINQILSGTFSSDSWVNLVMRSIKTMIDMKIFGDNPALYDTLDQVLSSNDTRMVLHKVTEMISWFTSTPAKGLDLVVQTLTKIQELLSSVSTLLNNMDDELPPYLQVLHDLVKNAIYFIQQLLTSGSIPMRDHYDMSQRASSGHNTSTVRRRRDVSYMPMRGPLDDFFDLASIDYPTLYKNLVVPPTQPEIMGMFHGGFANPHLRKVLEGATKDMDWDLEFSKKDTINALLGMTSVLTRPDLDYSSLDLWEHVINLLPDGFPYASLLKNITQALAREGQENLLRMQEMFNTVLLQTNLTDPQLLEHLKQLRKQVCNLEKTDSVQILLWGLSLEPGILCDKILPEIEILVEGVLFNMSSLLEGVFEVFVGEPRLYHIHANWAAAMSQAFGFNLTSLSAFNFTSTAAVVTTGEMVKNKTAFMLDLEEFGLSPAVVFLLTEAVLPDNNLEILSWLLALRKCNSTDHTQMGEGEKALYDSFCSMNPEEWFSFIVLMAQHLNAEKAVYRMVLPKEVQNVVQSLLQTATTIIKMMKGMLPVVHQLEEYLLSIESLGLNINNEFRELSRSQRTTISSGATFVTISRALCSKGILAVFGVAKNPHVLMAAPSFDNNPKREEMIEQFKIPRNATPFCTNMYLDMVNTTGGAIAWAFLKPMLMGKILYTPDTPQTRAIMNKANSTLQQLGDLRHYSQDWIKSSNYIVKSSEMLTQTLPLLQNSLGNSFVKNFIEMLTGINVDSMQETLNNFSNMTLLLEKNKDLLGQITTLSTLMVDLSSCITFDRYQGYDTEDELNRVAQDLAKNRNLYASVIFKLPKDTGSSRKRRSASSTITLPPKVHYTIRMHMDNVMRTDRVREPFFSKEPHISAGQTLRYNRGFIYLQETIDRAIIDIQANKTVTDTAVQIQPFPYPCHHRDEYLQAISFVFPLLLMIAWVLFVADFVKKLVHEREIKLHEYMKMMGVSPLSHFFAWFLESAFYLVITIFFLTLVLKYGNILPHSDGFLLFLYLCDYGLSVLAFSFLISTFFDKTYIAALSGSLLYVLSFFPFIIVMALEAQFSFSVKSLLGLFSPTAFSYASQYVSRYETQGEGIQWSNSYSSPIVGDTASFGWLCWLMLIDSFLYFIIGAYIRAVFPGKSGIPSPWYFPFTASFWKDLCGCGKSRSTGRGLFLTNILQAEPPVFPDTNGKGKGKGDLSSRTGENFSDLPVGVSLYGLSKVYGQQTAIENLNIAFYEGHVTSLLGHNGAGKTTTMSILTGLFPPSSGSVEVYGRDMQANLEDVRKELGVCMQYDVLFDHMTAKEHLLLYGQVKAPHWSKRELQEQVRTILEETGMYAHRHKRVGTLSGGMKRKLSISIAFIGGSRLVVLDEPTTGVDPCSRRSIWDIVIQHKKGRTIIMSTHHLDEAEVLSDRIAFLERGGLKCCGSPYYLKEQLGQGYKLTLTKKMHNGESKRIDNAELKAFVQAHVPEARLKEAQGSDLVYLLPPFSSNNASSYRSLLTALDSNLDALQLGCYGISDTTLEEVFLHLTHGSTDAAGEELPTISDTVSDTESISSYPESEGSNYGDTVCFTGTPTVSGVKLAWQQMTAILIKRFHHSRRDWKGLISQILLPVLFVVFAMGLGTIKSDLRHYPELELSPALYTIGPSYSFFSNLNSNKLVDTMLSFPGLDNSCLQNSNDQVCTRSTGAWSTANGTKKFSACKCVKGNEVCGARGYVPPHKQIPSSQIVYNVTDLNVENYLVATANDYIRNRYGGFDFGFPLPRNLKMDVKTVPQNRTLSKVWFNPEGHHTMPAYLSGMNNLILRSNLPADKDPSQYAISVSSHPYFGRPDDEDSIVQGMLQIMVALCILAGYSITTASFAIYEVNEHHSGSKRLQHIAGVSEPFYWIVNFFYDMVIYLIPVALTVGVIALFQVPAFTDRQNLGAVTVLLILFGFSTFPWMYLLSTVFKDAEMAFITYVCINLFLSVNTIIPTSILYFMRQITAQNTKKLTAIFHRLSHAFLIFPQFNFGNGLLELARMNIEVQILSGYGIDAYKNPFSTEALGWMMISSFIQGVVLFGLRLLWNKYIVRKIRRQILRRKSVHLVPTVDEDEDVAAEHLRVSSGAASSDVLQVNQLTKVYQHLNKKVPAVKKLSLGVPAGECFGLLGVNGAGKTTTFKMLTGDVSPTDGTAQIRDRNGRLVDIMECRNQGINIGYCPQVDALDDLLSGEEHLYFYARLHGISKREIPGVVNYLLRKLELNNYRDSIADSYSCGTRRKLSTALALVGHPQILLLDEPSSGMDPRTKRQLWKIISEEVKGKCAVVLTSHSMEECEALCGRLAIMVKGQFRCLGSLQHIKNRFGSGFTVKMYMVKASSDADAITRFMQSRFPSTYLKEQHSAMVEYHVPVAPGGVADIFGQLESSKEYLEIQHFSVSQTTLDEVFINFAMGKIGLETVPIDDEFDDDCSVKDVEA